MGVRRSWATRVQRAAHAQDQGRNLLQHAVEEPAQLIEFVAGLARRHARPQRTRLDRPDGLNEVTNRPQGAERQEHPPDHPPADYRDENAEDDPAERLQELVAVLRAHAHLQERPVGQLRGRHFQDLVLAFGPDLEPCFGPGDCPPLQPPHIELGPAIRHFQKERGVRRGGKADEEGTGLLQLFLDGELLSQTLQPGELVLGREVAQLEPNTVTIALSEGGGQQRIGDAKEHKPAQNEEGRIPDGQPKADRLRELLKRP